MNLSLRQSWDDAELRPGRTIRVVSIHGKKIHSTTDPGPTLRPLSEGIRASSLVIPPSADAPRPLAMKSLRQIITSLQWPKGDWKWLGNDPSQNGVPAGPLGTWREGGAGSPRPAEGGHNAEVQGIAFDKDYMYLVTTVAIWAVATRETAVEKTLPVDPALDTPIILVEDLPQQVSEIDENGKHYVGRLQIWPRLTASEPLGSAFPKHLSAPCIYRGALFVPGERNPIEEKIQWIWVFDTQTLGYRGRIGLDSETSLLFDGCSWCAIDPVSETIYATRWDGVTSVALFRLPENIEDILSAEPAARPAVEVERDARHPSLLARYVGRLPLIDVDLTGVSFAGVNGGTLGLGQHLFIDFMSNHDETVWGLLGFDLFTGRALKWLSLGTADSGFAQLQGIVIFENILRVLIWDDDAESGAEYSISNHVIEGALL